MKQIYCSENAAVIFELMHALIFKTKQKWKHINNKLLTYKNK